MIKVNKLGTAANKIKQINQLHTDSSIGIDDDHNRRRHFIVIDIANRISKCDHVVSSYSVKGRIEHLKNSNNTKPVPVQCQKNHQNILQLTSTKQGSQLRRCRNVTLITSFSVEMSHIHDDAPGDIKLERVLVFESRTQQHVIQIK